MTNSLIIIASIESTLCQQENLGRTMSPAQHLIEEEVVELVRAYQILGLLLDVSLLVGRCQLWRDRRINYVNQRIPLLCESRQHSDVAYQILNQRLWNAGINAIHRHMVTVIRTPSQCQFRQVASTNHHTAHLISHIHQDKQQEEHIVSQYALEYLRHKLIASVQTKEWQGLSLRVDARWQDRVGSYISFDGTVCDYQPYVLFNARLQWTKAALTVYADAYNILDNRSYVDFGNVPQPGIWAVVGTKYKF